MTCHSPPGDFRFLLAVNPAYDQEREREGTKSEESQRTDHSTHPPMTLNLPACSPLSMSKAKHKKHQHQHSHPPPPKISLATAPPTMTVSHDPSSSRSSSLAGRKRPREWDEAAKLRLARRTKSVGDTRDGRRAGGGGAGGKGKDKDKDREAFQRGLIAVFVPNALNDSIQGRMEHYNDLLAHFLPSGAGSSPPALPPLLPLVRALTAHVSLLSPEIHSALVTAIVGLPWAAGDDRFVKSFIGFCGVLVSAQPGWAKQVVDMAVRGLRWRTSYL